MFTPVRTLPSTFICNFLCLFYHTYCPAGSSAGERMAIEQVIATVLHFQEVVRSAEQEGKMSVYLCLGGDNSPPASFSSGRPDTIYPVSARRRVQPQSLYETSSGSLCTGHDKCPMLTWRIACRHQPVLTEQVLTTHMKRPTLYELCSASVFPIAEVSKLSHTQCNKRHFIETVLSIIVFIYRTNLAKISWIKTVLPSYVGQMITGFSSFRIISCQIAAVFRINWGNKCIPFFKFGVQGKAI